jgi:ribosome-binding factor A
MSSPRPSGRGEDIDMRPSYQLRSALTNAGIGVRLWSVYPSFVETGTFEDLRGMHMRERESGAGMRHQRVEVSIQEELASILRDDVNDPELEGVRITGVVLSPDYRSARVHFAVPRGRPKSACERAFLRASAFLRGRLAEAIELKRTPELRFVYEAEIA